MSIGWLVIAAIALVAFIVFGNRKTKPTTPVTPTTPTVPAGPRPAPTFLGFLLTKSWYGFGEQLFLNTMTEVHGCDQGTGAPTVVTGIKDNGSGPYDVRLRAYVKETGAEMPVYTTGSDHVAYTEVSGKWVPSGMFKVYLLGKCPYINGALSNCNEFIPLDEYNLTTKGAKAKTAASRACGCGGNGDGGSTVTYPTKPTTVVRIQLMVRNADGVIGDPHTFDLTVETRSCS